jgi:hypothetical protein
MMSLNSRNPNSATGAYTPIATAYGLTVLAALAVLVLLHRTFGSFKLEGGVR